MAPALYCKDVALKLGIKTHKCKRKFFLEKKNRAQHKLRTLCLDKPHEEEIIRRLFSIHPQIARCSRTPINMRIENLMGNNKFEICDNLRHQIGSMLTPRNDSPPSTTPPASTSTINEPTTSVVNNAESTAEVAILTRTEPSLTQQVDTLDNTTIASNDTTTHYNNSTMLLSQQCDDTILEEEEDEITINSDDMEPPPKKKRGRNKVLIDIINDVELGVKYRKKISELKTYKLVQQRADEGLAYLIRLCGYNDVENVEKESEMMNDLFLLMSEVKARAITSFKISPESLEGDYDQIQFNDDANNAIAGENQNAEKGKQIESFLKENLSNLHYKEASEMLSDLTDGQVKFQSAHLIYAKAREKVKGYKIKNSEYKEDNEQTQSILTNLERDENGEITMKTNKKVPEFLFGASLPIDEAMNMIYHRIGLIVGQIPDASMEDALGESMLLGCADAAEMDSLPSKSKHVTSFSVVPSSIFLVERCAVYTSSIYHILQINQLNSKKLLDHLKYILNDRFVDWISVKEKASFSIEFVDMHDAKFYLHHDSMFVMEP